MKRTTCYGCPALNGDGTCTVIAAGCKITINPDLEQGCSLAPDDDRKDQAMRANSPVLRTTYETPEECPECLEHLSLDWAYCPSCGRPTDWYKPKPLTLVMTKFCAHEKHGGICEKTDSFCNLGSCPYEDLKEYAPVRHGRWIIGEPNIIGVPIHCSECGWGSDNADQKKWMEYPGHKFCGACGALMDGGQDNE